MANEPTKPDPKNFIDAKIERTGMKIVVPETMQLQTVVDVLVRQISEDERKVRVVERIVEAFPFDGAIAFMKAMKQMFGWVESVPTPGFFGPEPPTFLDVPIGPKTKTQVIWGRFSIPGIDGWVQTGAETDKNGRPHFVIHAETKRKNQPILAKLAELTRSLVRKESIYRGQPIRLLADEDGDFDESPPDFLDLGTVDTSELIFSRDVETQIATNLFTPVVQTKACRTAGIPLKRGVLLAGPYGTGKTLTAFALAKRCMEQGWTFVLLNRVAGLQHALAFAKLYAPAVVFAEDIDRVVEGQDRTVKIDDILNTIDGVESKGTEILTVLTTNHLEKINKAMLRPGRLDAIIEVQPPDAEAVSRLLRVYGRGLIEDKEDLTAPATELAGQIPASIRECVERAKLYALHDSSGASAVITAKALVHAAKAMKGHMALLARNDGVPLSPEHQLGETLAKVVHRGLNGSAKLPEMVETMHRQVGEIHDHIV